MNGADNGQNKALGSLVDSRVVCLFVGSRWIVGFTETTTDYQDLVIPIEITTVGLQAVYNTATSSLCIIATDNNRYKYSVKLLAAIVTGLEYHAFFAAAAQCKWVSKIISDNARCRWEAT